MDHREGGDISYRDMMEAPEIFSPVRNFFEDCTIFITGATGFMGKILIEKLLRTCPNVKKIIVLARVKKGKEIAARFEEQFSDILYERLRTKQPNFMSKLSFVPGDIGELKLGLSDENYELIRTEINIIFHMAATVRFDERIQRAIHVNVRGTREVFNLAKVCPSLRAFLHVSTAFSNCIVHNIEEKFYDPPICAEKLIELSDILDEETLHQITPTLLGNFPNTYAYTKVAAENIVKKMAKGLPVSIIRPSIIVATAKEPVQGWIDNVYGPTGVVVGAGLGLLHTLNCDPEVLADLIPVDYVINACIVIAYETARVHEIPNKEKITSITADEKPHEPEIPIYNYVSSTKRPITWREFMYSIEKYGLEVPTLMCIWIYSFRLNKNYFIHMLFVTFLHTIPAYIVDAISYCIGKEPQLVKAYEKIHKFSKVITYFCTQRWYFHTQNVQNLCKSISADDQTLFDFDITTLNWDDYLYTYIRGLRVYLIKDPLDSLDKAKKRYRLLQIAHYTLITVVVLIFLKLVMMICQNIF